MKILVDIGHPGHVHYFRNAIKIMEKSGHQFLVIARDKEVTYKLLDFYKITYVKRGKGGKGFWGKLGYILIADFIILKHALKFKPDVFLSFSSTYSGHVAFLLRKPHILIDDTEHAKFEHLMYKPFADVILTPDCFYKNLGAKQIKFKSYMELCYLHPARFEPDRSIFKDLALIVNEPYVIFRFVSWGANHDIGQSGINEKAKFELINKISEKIKVFISAEGQLPEELEPYRIRISPEKIHSVLHYATLFIGEGATMASECAMLGTPAIYINSLTAGTIEDQENYELLFNYRNSDGALIKALELLNNPNLKQDFILKRNKMLSKQIDVTAFLVWFIENYPESAQIMKKDPDYQLRFK